MAPSSSHPDDTDFPEHPVAAREERARGHATPLQDSKTPPRGRKGKIQRVNREAYTYDVTLDGSTQPVTMGRLMTDYNDATLLPVGVTVAVSYDYGPPLIIGIIPMTSSRNTQQLATAGISDDPTGQENEPAPAGAYCRPPHLPSNLLPQDKVMVSPDGNMIGALTGGINTMKSGMAQVRTHLLNDLVEIVCRNYRHISDFGITEISNNNGKIGLTMRGGTDQTTEAGPDQENWTFRLDLNGDDLFRFELTQPGGTTLFKLTVNNDGKVELYGADGVDIGGGRNRTEDVNGDRTVTVKGNDVAIIEGGQNTSVNGNRQALVSGSESHVVGNDLTETAVRHRTDSTGGVHLETITGGNPLVAVPLQTARKTRVVNGTWEIDIGNPLSGANPAALAGFKLTTFSGDINLAVKVLGNIALSTLVGNVMLETKAGIASLKSSVGSANVDGTIVQLGPIAGAVNPLIKGTPYAAALTTFLTTVVAACLAAAPVPTTEPLLAVFATTLSTAATALLSQLPGMLSTKSFTA